MKKMKRKFIVSIEKRKDEIIRIGEEIYRNPETGFKEFQTSQTVARKMRELGLECVELRDIAGVKATIDTGKHGPSVAVLAELDALICEQHPDSCGETGAVHACGHNVQIAELIGVIIGLFDADILKNLSGKIHFIAVPAEEVLEIAFRKGLREKGTIHYLGGKAELLYRGIFDDVNICLLAHVMPGPKKFQIQQTSNGFLAKIVNYIGRAVHAGVPFKGINALYAANLGMMAINALRETFRDDDYVRVHPIITKGGDAVNIIPSDVRVEAQVRASTFKALIEANQKVNRALVGAAVAMGATVEIEDLAGYSPMNLNSDLASLAAKVMLELVASDEIIKNPSRNTGSTDMADLSTVMPVIQVQVGGGAQGTLHGADFKIVDPNSLYMLGTKFLGFMILELLSDKASLAEEIIKNFSPVFSTKQEFFNFLDRMFSFKKIDGEELFKSM